MSWSGFLKCKGCSNTEFTTVKMALLAPMPKPSASTEIQANPGLRPRVRKAYRTSLTMEWSIVRPFESKTLIRRMELGSSSPALPWKYGPRRGNALSDGSRGRSSAAHTGCAGCASEGQIGRLAQLPRNPAIVQPGRRPGSPDDCRPDELDSASAYHSRGGADQNVRVIRPAWFPAADRGPAGRTS